MKEIEENDAEGYVYSDEEEEEDEDVFKFKSNISFKEIVS